MKIFVTGTRGIPDIPGGIEKHCQELYPIIVRKGHSVYLTTRSPYVKKRLSFWKGVRILHGFAPRIKSFEAVIHTFLSLLKARACSPDVVHIHAVGPALLVPFARMLGLKVVFTHHGPDYDRQKWGILAKGVLKLGEKMGGCFANEVIVISKIIERSIAERCHRSTHLIYNGVSIPQPRHNSEFLSQIGVEPRKYILAVGRLVPEKGFHDLVEAFQRFGADYKLVIVGDADHETAYSKNLKDSSRHNRSVIFTGYLTGEPLQQLYSQARLFVLPSYHEGLPIVLLEAMSYGLSVLVSDIPAHKEVDLSPDRFFRCGDVAALEKKMSSLLEKGLDDDEKNRMRDLIHEKYNWNDIADQTIQVYHKIVSSKD